MKPLPIETGLAAAPRAGEVRSGDCSVVLYRPGGALLGVVDGLGHGEDAAAAAELALSVLESRPSESITSLMRCCHEALRGTRGVVMSLASIETAAGAMTWIGVGNADGVLLRADPRSKPTTELLLLRGGVIGVELPSLSESVLRLRPGDTLIFATDGIERGFAARLTAGLAPQLLAERILHGYARSADDALVLVARYLGGTP